MFAAIPRPLIVLLAAAAVVQVFDLRAPSAHVVDPIVTVALIAILFEGGMHIGWRRFTTAVGVILTVGVLGTFLTVAAAAALLHLLGLSWFAAVLVATAVAPTDPAVVFAVLGSHQIVGRASTVLEGESGANDPVGIALMASLVSAGALTAHTTGRVAGEFALQMAVGALVGGLGGVAMRRLPRALLVPLVAATFAFAAVAHGSGFLAVFVAGITVGDDIAPGLVRRLHTVLSDVGEIVAFAVLGATVDLAELTHRNVWLPGLALAASLAVVARPLLVGLCLVPARLARNEVIFVLFAGLKGAVPLLLGLRILTVDTTDPHRLYGIVIVVVLFSVAVQGTLTQRVARALKLI